MLDTLDILPLQLRATSILYILEGSEFYILFDHRNGLLIIFIYIYRPCFYLDKDIMKYLLM